MRALLVTLLLLGAASCGGQPGPEGPAGADGTAGSPGGRKPSVLEASAASFTTIADGTWRDVPGLSIGMSLVDASTPVEVGWIVSFPNNRLVTRVAVDGDAMPGSASVAPSNSYQASSGTYRTTLDAGAHTVTLQYRTTTPSSFDPSTDFESARIDVLHW